MIDINFNKLNPLELQIHKKMSALSQRQDTIRITDATTYCGCSISKISKFVKKLGFNNYKQYLDFLYKRTIPQKKRSAEIDRLKNFLTEFDISLIDNFLEMLNKRDKIVLFGYGPSFICAQYFEYKLRIETIKFVSAVPDEISAERLLDKNTLLVIFTATGNFKPFDKIKESAASAGAELLLITEEFNPDLIVNYDRVFVLTQSTQDPLLKPFQKSRAVFFIFIEEVMQHIIKKNAELEKN